MAERKTKMSAGGRVEPARAEQHPLPPEDLTYEEVEAKRELQAERERHRRVEPHPPGTEGG